MDAYILDFETHEHRKVSMMEGAAWMEAHNLERRLAYDETPNGEVSTVFLVFDHGWNGTPVLYETMVFGGTMDDYQERYETWGEAIAGHAATLARVIAESEPA